MQENKEHDESNNDSEKKTPEQYIEELEALLAKRRAADETIAFLDKLQGRK